MPFHQHRHNPENANISQPGAASGIYQVAHALGSIAAPTGNLRTATSGTTLAGTDVLLSPNSAAASQYASGQSVPSTTSALPPPPGHSQQQPSPHGSYSQFETPQRANTIGRRAEDAQPLPVLQIMSGPQHTYSSPTDYHAPNINLQQAPSQGTYNNPPTSNSVPGSLQPGGAGRPPPPQSAYTAPTTVPQTAHINTNAQQYTLPTRSNTMNASHNYSRSSPAGLEQKYVPFNNNPESQKYPQTPQQQPQKFFSPQTPGGGPANSPLVLEQIRPRANSSMNEEGMSGTTLSGDHVERQSTNSNYMSPWAMFAFDWCKYPVPHGNSAGKMAVGSYLEDTHNFVRFLFEYGVATALTSPRRLPSSTQTLCPKIPLLQAPPATVSSTPESQKQPAHTP
jgi:WD repeat-containing protein 68